MSRTQAAAYLRFAAAQTRRDIVRLGGPEARVSIIGLAISPRLGLESTDVQVKIDGAAQPNIEAIAIAFETAQARVEKGETDRFSLLVYRESTNQYIEAVIVIEDDPAP